MASEQILEELFQVAKISSAFKGITDAEVLKACQAYKDLPDERIRIAIANIRKKDAEVAATTDEQKKNLQSSKEKMISLHQQEENSRQKDEATAEKILADLFNKSYNDEI